MTVFDELDLKHRNRNYQDMHRLLIETAVKIMSERGAGAVSIAALARAMQIHRSTVYYHFSSREALLAAAQQWSADQAAKNSGSFSCWAGIDEISNLFSHDPEVLIACIDEYLGIDDFRQRYPHWDRLVAQIGETFDELDADPPRDAEAYWALMLTSAFRQPQRLAPSDHPFESLERLLDRLHTKAAAHVGG